jgi:hypothetical protein
MYLLSNTHADQDRPTGQEGKKEHKTWQGCLAKAHSGMKEILALQTLFAGVEREKGVKEELDKAQKLAKVLWCRFHEAAHHSNYI